MFQLTWESSAIRSKMAPHPPRVLTGVKFLFPSNWGWLIGHWLTGQPINQSTHQPINPSTHQPINPSTNQPINQQNPRAGEGAWGWNDRWFSEAGLLAATEDQGESTETK
jgi:hypothetical protein